MASGPLSLPMSHLKTLLSESEAFQTWTGSANAVAALDRIFYVDVADDDLIRPLAVVDIGEKWFSQLRAGGIGNSFVKRGELLLSFEADVAEEHENDDEAATLTFLDAVGGCIENMESVAGTGGYLSIHEIEFDEAPSRSIYDEEPPPGDYYRVKFIVTWGV